MRIPRYALVVFISRRLSDICLRWCFVYGCFLLVCIVMMFCKRVRVHVRTDSWWMVSFVPVHTAQSQITTIDDASCQVENSYCIKFQDTKTSPQAPNLRRKRTGLKSSMQQQENNWGTKIQRTMHRIASAQNQSLCLNEEQKVHL